MFPIYTMVYRRRKIYRKRRGGNRRRLNKAQLRQVKSVISRDQEHKYIGTTFSYTAIDRAASISRLSMPAQGVSYVQRVGDSINLTSLEFRFNAYLESTSTANHALRIIIFRWNMPTSLATPALGSILLSSGTVGDVLAPYNKVALRQGDFTILSDKLYSVGGTAPAPKGQKMLNLRKKRVQFDLGTGASDNSVYVLALSDDLTGTVTNRIFLQWNALINYVDG